MTGSKIYEYSAMTCKVTINTGVSEAVRKLCAFCRPFALELCSAKCFSCLWILVKFSANSLMLLYLALHLVLHSNGVFGTRRLRFGLSLKNFIMAFTVAMVFQTSTTAFRSLTARLRRWSEQWTNTANR